MSRGGVALHRQYTASLFRALSWRATWLPNEAKSLGDVGYLREGLFEQWTSLKDLGVAFSKKPPKSKALFDYQSSSGVSALVKAAEETAPQFSSIGKANAGVLITFSRAGAIVLSAPSCQIFEIDQVASLDRKLRELRRSKDWEKDWVVITKIVKAPSSTILVSGSANAAVELRAAGNLGPHGVNLARIGVGFSLARQRDMAVKLVAEGGLVPLYQAYDLAGRLGRGHLHPSTRKAARRAA
jgi:hypothetical protein